MPFGRAGQRGTMRLAGVGGGGEERRGEGGESGRRGERRSAAGGAGRKDETDGDLRTDSRGRLGRTGRAESN